MNHNIVQTLHPDGFRRNILSLGTTTILIAILSLTLPVLTLQVYDRILPNPESGTLPVLMTGVCIAVLMEIGLRLCRAYMLGWSGAAYEHHMSCHAINHFLNIDLSAIKKNGTGENLNRMMSIGKLREFHNGYDVVTYTELAFIVPYLALIGYIAGPLAFVVLIVLAIFTASSVIMGYQLNKSLHKRDAADDRRYDFLIESLRGVHTIKAFSLEKPFLRRYENLQYDATIANYTVTESTAGTFNAATVFGHIMLCSVVTVGAWEVLNGHMTSGSLIAAIFLSGRIMQPVQRALSLWLKYQDYRVAKSKVKEIFNLPTVQKPQQSIKDVKADGNLVLENVGFGDLFHDVNINLRPGETIQISGAYGSGKTTLLKIMAGLYIPSKGSVLIDNHSPLDYLPQDLLNHVGLVSTDGVMFRGRIRDNLTRFNTIPESDIRPIAEMLGINHDVARLPRGFDTWVEGSEQDSVPPGLKQRIAVARVLATHPKIILFDNAEHNLDREGYRQIHSMLCKLKGKVTMVLVADDNNISSLANRHFVLSKDGLTETTSYSDTIIPFKELRS